MRANAKKIRDRLFCRVIRLGVRCVTGAAVLALLATLFPWPGGVRPVMAGSKTPQVICPDSILEGNSAHMQLRLKNHHTICATVFTYNGSFTAGGDDYAGYDGVFMAGNEDSDSLFVPVITHEDSQPERDETFSIGFWEDGAWFGCVIRIIDDDSAEITEVAITSKPTEGDRGPNGWLTNRPNDRDTYRAGESIDVTVSFDAEVEVEGSPTISLYLGDGDGSWRGARYHSGSGSQQLIFRYQVEPTDRDDNGITVSAAAVKADRSPRNGFSGGIYARGTDAPVYFIHHGISDASDHKVDGRPYAQRVRVISTPPEGWSAYRANQVIEFAMAFDIDVDVHGAVTMGFYLGNGTDGWRDATYARGSGSDTLVFGYTVQHGDADSDGIQVALGGPDSSFGGGGRITAKGTDAEAFPYYPGTGPLADHLVDTAAPSITSVSIQSQLADGAAYRLGEVIAVAVTFSEDVQVRGYPELELDIGGEARAASFAVGMGPDDTAVFGYGVSEGDRDADGMGISANSIGLNDGGIFDSAGNAAGLSHEDVAANEGQRVDTATQG